MPHNTTWDGAAFPTPTPSNQIPNNEKAQKQQDSSDGINSTNTTVNVHAAGNCPCVTVDNSPQGSFRRRQSQQSVLAKYAMQSSSNMQLARRRSEDGAQHEEEQMDQLRSHLDRTLSPNGAQASIAGDGNGKIATQDDRDRMPPPSIPRPAPARTGSLAAALSGHIPEVTGVSIALNDTPASTAPNSPRLLGNHSSHSSEGTLQLNLGIAAMRASSGTSTPRVRPTTLDIPGLTKSKVSPDGRIAQRDVGAKLVIVMVGLPARGKSYITKKLARYLNWLQHDTRIFNVGERRREVAGGPHGLEKTRSQLARETRGWTLTGTSPPDVSGLLKESTEARPPVGVAQILLNGETEIQPPETPLSAKEREAVEITSREIEENQSDLQEPDFGEPTSPVLPKRSLDTEAMEQNASFFDPSNQRASMIREQVARETLDELLDFILDQNGSVGILDATNSTLERRKMVMQCIRDRAGPELNVLFLESRCMDHDLLEANMRLKLNGPDYRDKDPAVALEDFKARVLEYEKAYVPLGEYEEKNNMPYIQIIDVGRKIISHQIKGFLMAQANYYLLNFNLAPRQIWITRHGLSMDNVSGKIGGDSDLAPEGHLYARTLTKFMEQKRLEWDAKQMLQLQNSHFPPQPGDVTPPNPHYQPQCHPESLSSSSSTTGTTPDPASPATLSPDFEPKNFCVWTSMLKRSIQTAQYFNDEEYDIKQMRMLDELNAGVMEGLTYSCISTQFPEEYASRRRDKLHYRYPGPGGEGYLDIINRLRPVIVELERMTDHVLLVGHRSVARVLLAYFRGLRREEVADLDVPIGMLYCLEPRPYGVDFQAYRWDKAHERFVECNDFRLQRAEDDMQ